MIKIEATIHEHFADLEGIFWVKVDGREYTVTKRWNRNIFVRQFDQIMETVKEEISKNLKN